MLRLRLLPQLVAFSLTLVQFLLPLVPTLCHLFVARILTLPLGPRILLSLNRRPALLHLLFVLLAQLVHLVLALLQIGVGLSSALLPVLFEFGFTLLPVLLHFCLTLFPVLIHLLALLRLFGQKLIPRQGAPVRF
jgi:hypothetical protein